MKASFGNAHQCKSVDEVVLLIKENTTSGQVRRQAAAFGMVLAAAENAKESSYFQEALDQLTQLGKAKVALDEAAWHTLEVAELTGAILLSAQRFVDETTIPCTEWPTTKEVYDAVVQQASSLLES